MGQNASGETLYLGRARVVSAGRLGDLVDTPNVRNVKRGMPTKAIRHGYAFSDAAHKAAVQKLLKRVFNETSAPADDCCTDAGDDDCTSKGDNRRNT